MSTTYNNYRPEIRSLITRLVRAGYRPFRANNGEDEVVITPDEGRAGIRKLVECIDATDEGNLYVQSIDGGFVRLFLVLGNEPGVIVCDYGFSGRVDTEAFDNLLEEHYKAWEGRKQPTRTAVRR